MIRVAIDLNVFRPGHARREHVADWREGMVVGDLVPAELAGPATRAFVRGREVAREDPAIDGASYLLVVAPRDPVTIITYAFLLVASYLVTQALLPKPPPRGRDDDASPIYGFSGIRANRTEGEVIPVYHGRHRVGGQLIGERVESRGALGSFYHALISLGHGPHMRLVGRTTDTEPDRPLRSGDPYNPLPRGWIQVEDTDAADLDGVEVHVRMGTLEQANVPGFEFETQTVSIDVDVRGPEADADAIEPVFAQSNLDPTTAQGGGSSDVLFDAYGQSYSMLSSADAFTVVLEFLQGLYGVTTTGQLGSWVFALAVRYRELDGTGTPITTGGPEGDGWIRLRALPYIARLSQSAFTLDLRFPFYDPQTYVRPPLSTALQLNATGAAEAAYAQSTDFVPLTIMDGPSGAPVLGAFSIEAWVQLRPTDPTQTGGGVDLTAPAPIWWWVNTGSGVKGGVSLRIEKRTITISPGHTRTRIVPVVRLYKADGTFTEFHEKIGVVGDPTYQPQLVGSGVAGGTTGSFFAPMLAFTHVAITYKPNAQGALDRLRIYGDGLLVYEALGTYDASYPLASVAPTGVTMLVGRDATPNHLKGWIDELVLWQGEMTPDDVRRAWNGGQGRSTPPDPVFASGSTTVVRLFPQYVWHFDRVTGGDDGQGGGDVIPHDSTLAPNSPLTTVYAGATPARITFGPTHGHRTFIEQAVAGNARKTGRFEVEIMRGLTDIVSGTRFDDARWRELQLHTEHGFTYPGSPIIGIRVPASEDLNGGVPNITQLGDFRLPPVWDGASQLSPTFANVFSSNTAWVVLDYVLSADFGLGWIFRPQDVDLPSFRRFADICDEGVYDMRGHRLDWPDWTDMRYDVVGAIGPAIQVFVPTANVPSHWKVGELLGWYGLPAITAGGGPFDDTNADQFGGGGYEILAITESAGTTTVYCKWSGATPPWNVGTNLSTQVTGSLTGTVEGRERRFQYDGGLDTAESAWDKLVDICATARAVPIRDGRRLRIHVEMPRAARDAIGLEQVIAGTFEYEYLSPRTRTNAIDVSFVDRDLNYERSPASLEHPSVADTSQLSDIRRASYSLDGVVRRTQVIRHIRYLLNREHLVRRKGRLTGSVDMHGYEPGDVMRVAHDVAARGIGGRFLDASAPTELLLDRPVTIEPGKDYRIAIRRARDPATQPPEIVDVDVGATGTGVIDGNLVQPVTVTTSVVVPAKDDVFLFYEVDTDLLVSFDRTTLAADLRRQIEWSAYDDDVFAVEGIEDLPEISDSFGQALVASPGSMSAPPPPRRVAVEEFAQLDADGRHHHGVTVTWAASDTDIGVAGYEVHASVDGVEPRAMARVDGQTLSATFLIPGAEAGSTVRAWVVPVSASGARTSVTRAANAATMMVAPPPPPGRPGTLLSSIVGDLAVFRWDSVPGAASYELKRGGWILGQPVGTAIAGQEAIGPNFAWVSAAAKINTLLVPAQPTYYLRARSALGSWSHASTKAWSPRAIDSTPLDDLAADTFSSQSWEEFGDKWKWDGATTPNATVTDLQRHALGWLEFAGSALTATYETPEPEHDKGDKPELVYVSAFATADQIHPYTWADAIHSWAEADQLSWEGPLNELEDGDDAGRCTLTIYVRFLSELYVWSDWQEYRAGKFQCVAAQFRVVVTRPSTDFDVRIRRFSTDLLRAPRPRWDRSPLRQFAEGRALRNG